MLVNVRKTLIYHGVGRESAALSHQVLAELIGISKRSVQTAIGHLAGRHLIRRRRLRPTAVRSTRF